MSEYGSISMVQAFNYDKERLLHALDGQLMCGETETGFEYADATEDECRAYIIQVFDNAVYHALQGYGCGRVYEKVMEANGMKINDGQLFKDFMHFKMLDEVEQEDAEHYNYCDYEDND